MCHYIYCSYEMNNSNDDESHRLLIILMGKHKKQEKKWKGAKSSSRIRESVLVSAQFFGVGTFYAYSLQIYTNTLLVCSRYPYINP